MDPKDPSSPAPILGYASPPAPPEQQPTWAAEAANTALETTAEVLRWCPDLIINGLGTLIDGL